MIFRAVCDMLYFSVNVDDCVMTFSFLKCCLAEHCVADVIVHVNYNASRTVFR